MNILVTGGNGQLGCSISKISDSYPEHSFFYADLPEVDITKEESVVDVIKKNNINVIINCAAYTAVDKAETEKELASKVNVIGPRTLVRICKKYDLQLIHISTDYVFDGKSNIPLTETDKCDSPIGVYGATKREGELMILQGGVPSAIIRTSWLYSEFGNNFAKTMLKLSESKDEIGVVFDQIGTPTYAPDLARAIINILNMGLTENCEIYNYSNEGVCSWYDFAKSIFEISDISIKVNPIHTYEFLTLADRPMYSVLDKTKIKSLAIEVPYWRDSLKVCIKALKN